MNINNALAIDGWMSPVELRWLAEQARDKSIIVEVGCFLGRSTRALADNTDGKVFAVDDFLGPRDSDLTVEQLANVYNRFMANMAGLSNVVPVISSHRDPNVVLEIKGVPDMIFIDGSHEYEDVKADILLWRDQLMAGGLLCGHDYNPGPWPGVVKAVDEIFGSKARQVPMTDIWEVVI